MENNFDKRIRDLLDAAVAADTGFDLDKERVWNHIESRQKTKAVPFRKWVSHAAAVVIGILLCLPFLFRSEKEIIKTVTITNTIPSIQTITDTVLVVQSKIPDNHKPQISDKKGQTGKSIAMPVLQPKEEENNSNNITDLPAIAKTETPKAKIQVLHITDMENENVYPQARPKESYALFNKINFPARMDDKSETVSMIVSNQFFNSKN